MGPIPLIRLARVDSTQTFLRRHPELHPCAVMADAQTEGRGRQGHRWESAEGQGLWLSASLAPPDLPPGILLQQAMEAVIAALAFTGVAWGLKWPNDLVARKGEGLVKVGGIIGERVGSRLVLGLGVNLTSAPDLPDRAFPAACLAEVCEVPLDRVALAQAILDQWQHLESILPKAFRWPSEGESFRWEGGQGVCLGWEPDGRLKVTTAEGVQRLSVGDIRSLRS
ncbi:MAG TPA: biotin--[acetyl-CoA-carboxylase] ligase [Holophagaceae bacterium]|nr:biotin--[acetyl-CoA-carboxylase] ligase [Holophagaceae bacterium]